MASILLLVIVVGVLGMVGLFAAGILTNRSRGDRDGGGR